MGCRVTVRSKWLSRVKPPSGLPTWEAITFGCGSRPAVLFPGPVPAAFPSWFGRLTAATRKSAVGLRISYCSYARLRMSNWHGVRGDALNAVATNRNHRASGRVADALRQMQSELARRAVRELQKMGAVIYQTDQGSRVTLGRSYRGGATGMALLENMPDLVSLTLQQTAIADAAFLHLRNSRSLENLSLMETDVGDAGLKHLSGLANLKTLHLTRPRITAGGLAYMRDLSNLTSLTIQGADQAIDEGLVHLSGLAKLQRLDLSGTPASDKGVSGLKPLHNLELLNLNETRVSESGLRELDLSSLKQLELRSTAIDDQALEVLTGVSVDFNYLDLEGTAIGDSGLVHVAKAKSLWYLNLARTRVTDAGLAHLNGLEQLRTLHLSGCVLTGVGLSQLANHEFSELKLDKTHLDNEGLAQLKGRRFRSLGLQYTRIDDAGLPALKDLEQLEWLYLDGTGITDVGLPHLAALQNLRGLSLADTGVTEDGMKSLERTLFKCRITR